MTVLFVAPRYHTNQNYLVKGIIDRGFNVKFASYFSFGHGANEHHAHLTPDIIKCSNLNSAIQKIINKNLEREHILPSTKYIYNYITQIDPDLVIVRDPKKLRSLVFLVLCLLLQKKVILYNQNDVYGNRGIWKESLEWIAGDLFGLPIFSPRKGSPEQNSRSTRNYHYIPFAIEPDDHEKEYLINGGMSILAVGKMQPRKRFEDVVAALERLDDSSIDVSSLRLKIVGKSWDDEYESWLRDQISRSALSDQISILKDVEYGDMGQQYRKADLFVFPARDEDCGFSHLEAMAHGVPCLVSERIGNGDYVTDEECGYEFETGSPSSLARQIARFAENPSLISSLGRKAKQVVAKKHDPERITDKILALQDLQVS
jgi:glycosyltransferase involved in cell wall biosynthesis